MKDSATFKRILAALEAAPLKFKIVFDDGTEYGTLEVSGKGKKKKKQMSKLRPHGTISAYLTPLMVNMKIGELRTIPLPNNIPDFNLNALLSNMSSRSVKLWGAGSATVCTNAQRTGVEILRIK